MRFATADITDLVQGMCYQYVAKWSFSAMFLPAFNLFLVGLFTFLPPSPWRSYSRSLL